MSLKIAEQNSDGSRPSDKGGARSSRPWDKGGGGGSQKNFFRPFGPQFSLKIRGPSPGSDTAVRIVETDHSYFEKGCRKKVHSPERYCGWFWVHCSLKKFERMIRETMDICLWVLKESRNSKFELQLQLQCQEQCIDHIPYYLSGLSCTHFFRQPFSK